MMRRFFPSTIKGGDALGFQLPNSSDVIGVYSLRKYNVYSGPCINIIRESDGNTTDIGFLGAVVDTAAIEAFCSGTVGRVRTWYDQSGNNNQTPQINDNARPWIYESGSLVTLGGKPSMRWLTSDFQRFELPNAISVESAFFVYKLSSLAGILITLAIGNGTNDQIWAGGSFSGVDGFAIRQGAATRVTNTSENLNYNLSSFFGGSDDRIDTNNSDPAIAGTPFGPITIDRIGRAGNGLTGNYHEVIFYSTSQFANKATIENMINDYYSIY